MKKRHKEHNFQKDTAEFEEFIARFKAEWTSSLVDEDETTELHPAYKGDVTTSRPHRLMKTSSMQSKPRDLHLKRPHRETSGNTFLLLFFTKMNNSNLFSMLLLLLLLSNKDRILALTGQFKQLSHEPEKFQVTKQDSNPRPLQCLCSALTNWATKSHSWEQVNLFSRENIVSRENIPFTFSRENIPFTGKLDPNKVTSVWLRSSVGKNTAPVSQRSWSPAELPENF